MTAAITSFLSPSQNNRQGEELGEVETGTVAGEDEDGEQCGWWCWFGSAFTTKTAAGP